MLELKNVTKTYRTKAGTVNALDGVSLTFPSKGLVFISGKSGCGKTTLLNVIGGLDGLDGGDVCIQGKSFSAFSAKEYDSYRNTLVGFVFQEYNLLAEYTVEYNIKLAMELQGVPVDEEAFEKLLKDVGIEELRSRKPSELSGGQRQRVAITRALVKQPRIIMADEPTGALDSATGMQVLETLKKLSEEKLVIVVSHDLEFAQKYADRIIYLVDGKVVDDITFTEKELSSSVSETENAVIVKEGADLTAEEKDVLAKAVKEKKKIQLTEKLCFRDKKETGEVRLEKLEPVAFKRSKMKLKSSGYLGIKALTAKPVRLFFTILISAFAFAVFGMFDTIANFTAKRCLTHHLKENASTVVATANYIVDYNSSDKYNVKISDEAVDDLSKKTDGAVKGIFYFNDNTYGNVGHIHSIEEISNANVSKGTRYYTTTVNGFIEFDESTEIGSNGKFKNFGYQVKYGRYPRLQDHYDSEAGARLQEVAISKYLAESMTYYARVGGLTTENVTKIEDLIDTTVTLGQDKYKIVGIIDCGDIPSKYDVIKNSTHYNNQIATLLDDYDRFINSGAQKCLFVAQGFKERAREKNGLATIYYGGNADRKLKISNTNGKNALATYVYNSEEADENNVLLFGGQYGENGKMELADDEVLIDYFNLESLFVNELNSLKTEKRTEVKTIFNSFKNAEKETVKKEFQKALNLLGKTEMNPIEASLETTFKQMGAKSSHTVKIVGFYFDFDLNRYASKTQVKLMMNGNLMRSLSIYDKQGDYSQILFSEKSVKNGSEWIAKQLTAKKGFALTWYKNAVLETIQENEPVIRQAAELFLYAALALAVFSVFMLYNYISTSIARKQRSVGVLRGLGAGGKDIFLIFLFESLIIGLVNGILANVICAVSCALVNSYIINVMNISVSFVLFELRQLLIILGTSLLTVFISSALPIFKISKKKPVELIRRP